MKAKEEIYSVKFNKFISSTDMMFTVYTLGVPFMSGQTIVTPESITLKGDKITITFEEGLKHTISYNTDVEIFERPVVEVKPKTDKKD
jgi:hypothetical protein